jgi:hypothetical protein
MPAGRPKIKLDVEKLKKCAEKQWTNEEIGAFFGVSKDTIERNYAADVHEARHNGKAKLRDLIWQRALNGSDRMLEHAANRFLGPIVAKHEISIQDLIETVRAAIDGTTK